MLKMTDLVDQLIGWLHFRFKSNATFMFILRIDVVASPKTITLTKLKWKIK
jgi:hypothetical protein